MTLDINQQVNYQHTNDILVMYSWFAQLPDVIACDFEAAPIFDKSARDHSKQLLAENQFQSFDDWRYHEQVFNNSALVHPSAVKLTHLAIGTSPTDAKVIIFSNNAIRRAALKWLVTTPKLQLWHNAGFDLKHIHYHTGKFPLNYHDTQVLAKTILNHCDNFKSNTQLKHLLGYRYGAWAVAPDMFANENLYDESFIKYAATDACATYSLFEEIQSYLED